MYKTLRAIDTLSKDKRLPAIPRALINKRLTSTEDSIESSDNSLPLFDQSNSSDSDSSDSDPSSDEASDAED